MRFMDYFLQNWRGRMTEKYITEGDILLDVGCFDGLFLAGIRQKVSFAVGVDVALAHTLDPKIKEYLLVSDVTAGLPFLAGHFDVIVMLAVFEHLQQKEVVLQELARVLRSGGKVVLTVPGHQVDRVLDILIAVGVADGMSLDEHHGYDPKDTPALFERYGFVLKKWQRFQLGLNNLFIFTKS